MYHSIVLSTSQNENKKSLKKKKKKKKGNCFFNWVNTFQFDAVLKLFFSEAAGKAIQSCGFEPATLKSPHRNKQTEIECHTKV